MPTPHHCELLTPMATALQGQIEAQLRTAAAHLAPSGIRSCIASLAGLVVALSARVDQLSNPKGTP